MSERNPTVEYRDIPGFPGYQVGSDGSVRSRWKAVGLGTGNGSRAAIGDCWRQLSIKVIPPGHVQVVLTPGRHIRLVHRLVLETFVGPCPQGMECCHNDGNPGNNAIGNLRWDTHQANENDKDRHGTRPRGERHKRSKLTEDQVRAIVSDYANGGTTYAILAAKYGVCLSAIGHIITRRRWAHIR